MDFIVDQIRIMAVTMMYDNMMKNPYIAARCCSLEYIIRHKSHSVWKQETNKRNNKQRPWLRGRRDNILSLLPPAQSLKQGWSRDRCFIVFSTDDILPWKQSEHSEVRHGIFYKLPVWHKAAARLDLDYTYSTCPRVKTVNVQTWPVAMSFAAIQYLYILFMAKQWKMKMKHFQCSMGST